MPSYAQELKLLDITGQWFCHGLDTEDMGQALSSLSLFPQATASWKAFLEYNGEFIDKKEPEEYDFSKRPCIDNSIVEAAFKQFESDSTPGNFDKILMDIKKKGQPSSRQPTSTAGTSSSLGVGSKLHVPTRKGSVSPVRASTRARTQNRRYSGNFELSGDEGSRGRQGKAASPSDRSDPADDDGDITVVGRKHRKTILDDSDDEDEDALPASPVRKKRKKGTDRSSAETAPKKKLRPTQQEQEKMKTLFRPSP